MRLLVNVAKIFKIDLPEQIVLVNDYQRVELQAMKSLLDKHNISYRELNEKIKVHETLK